MTNVSYKIAMNIYRKLGGEAPSFDNTEDVYNAINDIYASSKGRIDIEPLEMTLTENGQYIFDDTEITGYMPVQVNVDFDTEPIHKAGFNEGYDCGIADQKDKLTDITITENGTYTREDGYNNVVVEIETGGGGGAGFDYSAIGYEPHLTEELNLKTMEDIAYAQTFYDRWYENPSANTDRFCLGDKNLIYAPRFDMSFKNGGSNKSGKDMFNGCTFMEIFPGIEGQVMNSTYGMFYNCEKLKRIEHFDTSSVTDMSFMFSGCKSLLEAPWLDTSSVTKMHNMFNVCDYLTTIPEFDTSSVTSMNSMFYNCKSLIEIPWLDTSNVTDMYGMFYYCFNLTTIPELDASNVKEIGQMFNNCTALTNVGGLKNLGMQAGLTLTTSKYSSLFYYCGALTHDSMLNIVNGLYDRASAGYSTLTLYFNATPFGLLTDEEKAIATNKGWTLAS